MVPAHGLAICRMATGEGHRRAARVRPAGYSVMPAERWRTSLASAMSWSFYSVMPAERWRTSLASAMSWSFAWSVVGIPMSKASLPFQIAIPA